ncbi:UNVERIFIED_ORG: hypothetical protein GGD51_005847 [Rhizobium esperanzae]
MTDLDGLTPENDPVGIDCRGNSSLRQWDRLPPAADDLVEHFARLGEKDPVLFVEGEQPRLEALQAGDDIRHAVTQMLQSLPVELGIGSAGLAQPGEKPGRLFGRIPAGMPDKGEVKIVAKQVFPHHALAVSRVQTVGEGIGEASLGISIVAAAHHMRPERQPLVSDIAIERVQAAVQAVEVPDV